MQLFSGSEDMTLCITDDEFVTVDRAIEWEGRRRFYHVVIAAAVLC